MKKFFAVLALFAVLVVVYFHASIFTNNSILITRHLGSDLYAYIFHAWTHLNWLKSGFVPIGNYWVPSAGGYPASPMDQLIVPSNLLLIALLSITHNITTVLRIFDPLVYFIALVATFWYGKVLFKKYVPAIVLSVAYVFSMYGVGQLEHLDLLSAMIFVPLALGCFELLFSSGKAKYVILCGVCVTLTYLSHPYAVFFLLGAILLRFMWEMISSTSRRTKLVETAQAAIIALLTSLPFLILQLHQVPSQAIKTDLNNGLQVYAQPPGLFFFRLLPNFNTPEITMYLGVVVVALALIPIVLGKVRKLYVFALVTTVLCMLYAAGRFSPINLAQFIHNTIPTAFFVRVPGRAMIVGCLTLAVCTAIGVELLKKKWWVWVCILLIFADFFVGFAPPTYSLPFTNNDVYTYISQQPGNFRVEEIPSVYAQADMTSMYTGHDTLSWQLWDYGYSEPMVAFTNLYEGYLNGATTAQQAAEYGVRYIILNLNPTYYSTLSQDINSVASQSGLTSLSQVENLSLDSSYKLVYSEDDQCVYENLLWVEPNYTMPNPDKIIATESGVISQCYDKAWKTSVGVLSEKDSELYLTLPTGVHTATLTYSDYDKELLWFLAYIPLIGVIVWLLRKKETKQ